ncbi:hypothetical protein WJX72_000865 [[Myrmecia] bisecta]|uniref:SAP domain-containing protein n=1 Tax=[Myrmecia] bisecta TaxID=41462 RepID=A0AAW1PFM4_9CHLO
MHKIARKAFRADVNINRDRRNTLKRLTSSAEYKREADAADYFRNAPLTLLSYCAASSWHALAGKCGVVTHQLDCPPEFDTTWKDVEANIDSYDVKQLKTCLKALGQKISGKKAELVERVLGSLPTEQAGASPALKQEVTRARHRRLCQTDAMKQFKLTKKDLQRLPVERKPNPINPDYADMKLFK